MYLLYTIDVKTLQIELFENSKVILYCITVMMRKIAAELLEINYFMTFVNYI